MYQCKIISLPWNIWSWGICVMKERYDRLGSLLMSTTRQPYHTTFRISAHRKICQEEKETEDRVSLLRVTTKSCYKVPRFWNMCLYESICGREGDKGQGAPQRHDITLQTGMLLPGEVQAFTCHQNYQLHVNPMTTVQYIAVCNL